MRSGWALAAVAAAGVSLWMLVGAVDDLAAEPTFAAVLRLVVELIAAVVVVGFCARRALDVPPRPSGGTRPDHGDEPLG